MRKVVLSLVLLALAAGEAMGVSEGAPGALQPLLAPSARAAGMGQAFVAVADDATAAYWNPASLALRQRLSLTYFYTPLVPDLADDIRYNFAAGSFGAFGGTLGLSLIYLTFGTSDIIDEQGNAQGSFKSYDLVPTVSYGSRVSDRLSLGVSFKIVYSKLSDPIPQLEIGDGTGTSIAGDLGVLYTVAHDSSSVGSLRLAGALQNLGPNIAYNDQDQAESLPRMFRLGAAWAPNLTKTKTETGIQLHRILVTAEMTKPLVNANDPPIWKGGAEYTFYDLVALRGGWVQDNDGEITDLTYGAGFMLQKTGTGRLRFDYASFPQHEDLERVNKFSLSYDF